MDLVGQVRAGEALAIARITRTSRPADRPDATDDAAKWVRVDPDVQLMLAFQAGDEAAFTALVRRNQGRVYSVIHRFCGSVPDAEDLTQEVFVRVFRTARRYRPSAKFSTWLYRIAVNVSLNALRSRRRQAAVSLDAGADGDDLAGGRFAQWAGPSPDEAADADELAVFIRRAVDDLGENQRMAIILSHYENMNYEQIAEVLDCTTMAVKSLLARGRARLRQLLQQQLRSKRT